MIKLDEKKLQELNTANADLDKKYGIEGTESRSEFNAKAEAWYLAEVLRDERKKQNISQETLAEIIGKKRPYITLLEAGKTDMQLSTFLKIANALGLKLSLNR